MLYRCFTHDFLFGQEMEPDSGDGFGCRGRIWVRLRALANAGVSLAARRFFVGADTVGATVGRAQCVDLISYV
jgi:hypothetical protein